MNAAPIRMTWPVNRSGVIANVFGVSNLSPEAEEAAGKVMAMYEAQHHSAKLPDTRDPRGIEVQRAEEAEGRRKRIVAAMGKDRLTRHEISQRTRIPSQAVYEHLRILKRRKVVDCYKPTNTSAARWYVRQGA